MHIPAGKMKLKRINSDVVFQLFNIYIYIYVASRKSFKSDLSLLKSNDEYFPPGECFHL